MTTTLATTTAKLPTVEQLEREILRFARETCLRADADPHPGRRRARRYNRSWPISIVDIGRSECPEMSAALYNGSRLGLAFLSRRPFERGATLLIRLFCMDESSPRVPAVVRHATPTQGGYLVGCEFSLKHAHLASASMHHEIVELSTDQSG